MTPYAYSHEGKVGVTLQMRCVMLVKRGDGGVTDADHDFDDVEVPEEAMESTTDSEQIDEDDDTDSDGEEF